MLGTDEDRQEGQENQYPHPEGSDKEASEKEKEVKPSRVPEQEDFLSNPDDLYYEISCCECKEPLWNTRILKRSGNQVISTETKSMPGVPPFHRRIEKCPFCARRFYRYKGAAQVYLIRDLHSGIQKLI